MRLMNTLPVAVASLVMQIESVLASPTLDLDDRVVVTAKNVDRLFAYWGGRRCPRRGPIRRSLKSGSLGTEALSAMTVASGEADICPRDPRGRPLCHI